MDIDLNGGVGSRHYASPITAVITRPDQYNPRAWANVTTALICYTKPNASLTIRSDIARLQQMIYNLLDREVFRKASPLMSEEAVQFRAREATGSIIVLTANTKWAMQFSQMTIRAMIQDAIARNLRSACASMKRF